ncbi:GPI ethanolamine phosphate transferase 3 [Citrus sinensis]|nr:GPI ethanolamine phosphate transferase 3 [Citrus sinensis]
MKRSAVDPEWLDLGQARNVMNFSVRKKRRNESRMIGFYLSRSQVLEMMAAKYNGRRQAVMLVVGSLFHLFVEDRNGELPSVFKQPPIPDSPTSDDCRKDCQPRRRRFISSCHGLLNDSELRCLDFCTMYCFQLFYCFDLEFNTAFDFDVITWRVDQRESKSTTEDKKNLNDGGGGLVEEREMEDNGDADHVTHTIALMFLNPLASLVNHIPIKTNLIHAVGQGLLLIVLSLLFLMPSEPKPWMDKLQVLQKLASTKRSARIFKAIADPPTTSLQRLKGLTTGGLPTFIDVGNSFGAPAILEDNLIHQVDNGCIEHLLPSLYEEDWDVLIAHFLGVDHAGHILGVDSVPMIEKLEQYNEILDKVIEVLDNQSGPGGLHENTFLLVMGDHGQTINGDHGGGSAEEVETSVFAMSFKKPPSTMPSEFDTSSCEMDLLDFAATVSALLGVPFPFGRCRSAVICCGQASDAGYLLFSIGRVSPELYALGPGTWNLENNIEGNCPNQKEEEWMQNYCNVLCINSWQVKRYIDIYSASSVIGFSSEDLLHISDMYAQAEENWSCSSENLLLFKDESCYSSLPLKRKIDAYFKFLLNVAELARSKWTEFDLKMMGIGFVIILISLPIYFLAMMTKSVNGFSPLLFGDSEVFVKLVFALFMVVIRACSFLSNSYILEEGKVASFLLATTAMFKLRNSIKREKMLMEVGISVHWASESDVLSSMLMLQGIGRNFIPRIIYAVGLGQLLLLAFSPLFHKDRDLESKMHLLIKTLAMLSSCSSTIIVLSGKQGPLVALATITGERGSTDKVAGILTFDPLSVTQWSLLATCLFFVTGHWCAFDGLRYGAAFIGYDEFVLVRQAILLTIDTFGFSHIIPVFGLPFLVARQKLLGRTDQDRRLLLLQLSQMYLMYGLITAASVIATIICVIIQRRHLMVWGLFAPKFVFDVVGLILTDILICLAWFYYIGRRDDGTQLTTLDHRD